jgi:hypothetical protein
VDDVKEPCDACASLVREEAALDAALNAKREGEV